MRDGAGHVHDIAFGLLWPFRNPDWHASAGMSSTADIDLVVESEHMGFDDAWLTEHHFIDDGYSPSLLPIGAAIAARHIGSESAPSPLLPLHNPVRVAEDTATFDLISGGRFDLRVGLGYRIGSSMTKAFPRVSGPGACRRTDDRPGSCWRVRPSLSTASTTRYATSEFPCGTSASAPPDWVGGTARRRSSAPPRKGLHFLSGGPGSATVYDAALRADGYDPQRSGVAAALPTYVASTRKQAWRSPRNLCATWSPDISSGRRRQTAPLNPSRRRRPRSKKLSPGSRWTSSASQCSSGPRGMSSEAPGIPLTLAADAPGVRDGASRDAAHQIRSGWSFSYTRCPHFRRS